MKQALDGKATDNLREALLASRSIEPHNNNWLLFSAIIEVALETLGEEINQTKINYAIKAHNEWYMGDGIYGDGPRLANDYYNSFVIQPLLIDVLKILSTKNSQFEKLLLITLKRAQRYALILECLIAPDGTFPTIGRSLSYRTAAFHHLAQATLQGWLPEELKPNQIRCALSSVIERTLGAADSYDDDGWLQIGLAGHQPSLGEKYICTGSLYLASNIFLPLGLDEKDLFWTGRDKPWTSQRIWINGEDLKADIALKD